MTLRNTIRAALLASIAVPHVATAQDATDGVRMTWFGITNWYYEIGDTGVLIDGAVSKFWEDNATSDAAEVDRVFKGLDQGAGVDMIFIGHEHADHSIDAVEWARVIGAPIYTSEVACDAAIANGLPEGQCTPVYGGEVIDVNDDTQVRVVRWSHSFGCDKDSAGGTEGLETFGFFFTHRTADGTLAWFMSDSGAGNAELVTNRIVDGVDYGAPLANLADAVRDAGVDGFDLWQGGPESRIVNQARVLVPAFDIKTFMPQHFGARGGYDITQGLHYPFDLAEMPKLAALLDERDVELVVSENYFDAYVYDASGVRRDDNAAIKTALGLPASGTGPQREPAQGRDGMCAGLI